MSARSPQHGKALAGCTIVITRPAGTGGSLARTVRQWGGTPLSLPGLSLRAIDDPSTARAQWLLAQQHDDLLIFTSPAAVRYATTLAPLATSATLIATGQGTARALRRHGVVAQVPATRQDSEGLLALPVLQSLQGRRVALITAPDGRGLLQEQLVARGAQLREVHVYARTEPHLHRRHVDAVLQLPARACVLLSSAQAMRQLGGCLPPIAWDRLRCAPTVTSSARLAALARAEGFLQVRQAASAQSGDLLAAAVLACSHRSNDAGHAGC